jgi:lactoylglutathione lyase
MMTMRSTLFAPLAAIFLASAAAGPLPAQTETLLYDHVHMSVPDPQAAAKWYLDHLGGEFIDGREDRILVGTTRIMFLRGDDRRPSAGSVIDHLGFSVTDLDATVGAMEAAGATVTTPPRDVPGLFRLAFVDDPWGVRLEILHDPQHLGFHHVHLRSPDPETTFAWYLEHFGGVRTPLRGRLDGILYPGNVWLLIQRGDAVPSQGTAIDHIGWRALDLDTKVAEIRAKGATIQTEPRPLTLPNGEIHFSYVGGPDGARLELVQRAADMR